MFRILKTVWAVIGAIGIAYEIEETVSEAAGQIAQSVSQNKERTK